MDEGRPRASRAALLSVGLVSALALSFEITLLRLFAVRLGATFAAMAVSLAVLGIGASGSLLTLLRAPLTRRPLVSYPFFAALFGVTAMLVPAAAFHIPFAPESFMWDPASLLLFALLYALCSLPFVCSGACVGLALSVYPSKSRVYRADLIGAGLGAAGVLGLLQAVRPETAVKLCMLGGFTAAALFLCSSKKGRGAALALFLAGAVAFSYLPQDLISPEPSPYRPLSRALLLPGARIEAETFGPRGYLAAVASPEVPFRHAPGLSPQAQSEVPEQMALFLDGGTAGYLTRRTAGRRELSFFTAMPASYAFSLTRRPTAAVLRAGGGFRVLETLYGGAANVAAVEQNPMFPEMAARFADFTGHLYADPAVTLHTVTPRAFLETTQTRFDLIRAQAPQPAMLGPADEDFLFTVEGLERLLSRLDSDGLAEFSLTASSPPVSLLRLAATLKRAAGPEDAPLSRRLAVIRTPATFSVLLSARPLEPDEIDGLLAFCRKWTFHPAFYPGIDRKGGEPGGTAASLEKLLGPEGEAFIKDYKYDISPPTDDRPYFSDQIRLFALPEMLAKAGSGGLGLVRWGPVVSLAVLAQALAAGLALVLAPLFLRARDLSGAPGKARLAAYFVCLGLAFLAVEIIALKQAVLLTGHVVAATSLTLCAFLLFAGLGSGASARISARAAFAGVLAAVVLFQGASHLAFPHLLGLPPAARWTALVAAMAPAAFFMGMPFPKALARFEKRSPAFAPWAWAVNGCASVAAPPLAQAVSSGAGYLFCAALALGLYALAWLLYPRRA